MIFWSIIFLLCNHLLCDNHKKVSSFPLLGKRESFASKMKRRVWFHFLVQITKIKKLYLQALIVNIAGLKLIQVYKWIKIIKLPNKIDSYKKSKNKCCCIYPYFVVMNSKMYDQLLCDIFRFKYVQTINGICVTFTKEI